MDQLILGDIVFLVHLILYRYYPLVSEECFVHRLTKRLNRVDNGVVGGKLEQAFSAMLVTEHVFVFHL